MFEDFVRNYDMEDKIKPSKKRVNAERAALRSLIEQEDGMMKKTKKKSVYRSGGDLRCYALRSDRRSAGEYQL